jgi:hypothetical protein
LEIVDALDAGHPEQPWAVQVGVALEDSGALIRMARAFAMNLSVQAFMLLSQDLGPFQTSSFSFIDGDVFRAHDGYEFRRPRKLGARGRLIPTRRRRDVGFLLLIAHLIMRV